MFFIFILIFIRAIFLIYKFPLSKITLFVGTGKPNLLFIMIDAVRPDHLSCYGYKRDTSPNIDKIAHQGVIFSQAIVQAPWTKPFVASIIGFYPWKHGVLGEGADYWLDNLFTSL